MVVAETVNPAAVESVLPELIVNEERAAVLTSRVTVNPPSMVTAVPAPGTEAPGAPPDVADQVPVLFQLPDATEKRWPSEFDIWAKNIKSTKSTLPGINFFGSNLIKTL